MHQRIHSKGNLQFVPMFVMLSVWCVLRVAVVTAAMHISHNILLLFCVYPLTWFISSVIYLISRHHLPEVHPHARH